MVCSTVAQSKITTHDITTKHEEYRDRYRCIIRSVIRRFRYGNVMCETFDSFHKRRIVLTLDSRRNTRGNHAYLSIIMIVTVIFEKCLKNERRCSISAYQYVIVLLHGYILRSYVKIYFWWRKYNYKNYLKCEYNSIFNKNKNLH